MRRDQFVQPADAGRSLTQPPRGQPPPGLVHQIHIVMLLGPVIADKDHRSPPSIGSRSTYFEPEDTLRRPNGSVLKAARHPSSVQATHQPVGARSTPRNIDHRFRFSKCSPAGGSVISLPRQAPKPRQRAADRSPLGSHRGWHLTTSATCASRSCLTTVAGQFVSRITSFPQTLAHSRREPPRRVRRLSDVRFSRRLVSGVESSRRSPSRPAGCRRSVRRGGGG